MKKLLTVMFGLASLCFVGCMQDVAELEVPTLGLAPQIRIDGSINQEYVSRVDDGGFCTGDQIGLYGVNYTEENTIAGELLDKGNQVDNARYTFDAENWVWKSSGSIYYKDAETNIDLYGYYPYGTPESVRAYEFEVQRDQTGENTVDGYGLSDFLWGKAENIAPTEAKVKLRFNHILACANVVLTEGEGFLPGEFESLKKQVLLMNTTRKAVIDLQSGAVEATVEAESEGLVMKANDEGFRAVVVPQTLTAGTSLFTITLDGINYRFKNSTTDVTYKSGKQTNFTIKLKKKSHEGEYELALVSCEIVDWVADLDAHGGEARQYFVVKMEEAGTLEQTIRAANKNPDKIKNLKISGNICKADFEFMRNSMALLQAVNLKETKIVGSWRYHVHFDDGKGWRDEYFAGNMPESEQERQAMVRARAEKLGVEVTGWSSCNVYSYDDEIPFDAFCDKTYLTYFCFPEKVTKIGDNAFNGTLLSGALIIPNDVVEIGGGAFANTNITSLQLPHVLKILGGSAFSGCKSLASPLSLPESLESIGGSCFAKCGMLTGNVVLPHKLTSIPGSCFQDCKCLTGGLDIPEGVESIGSYAFNGCIGMRGSIKLPNSLKSIGSHAFYQSSFQGELVIPAQIKILTQCCFSNTNITSVVFKEGSELILLQGNNGDGEGW